MISIYLPSSLQFLLILLLESLRSHYYYDFYTLPTIIAIPIDVTTRISTRLLSILRFLHVSHHSYNFYTSLIISTIPTRFLLSLHTSYYPYTLPTIPTRFLLFLHVFYYLYTLSIISTRFLLSLYAFYHLYYFYTTSIISTIFIRFSPLL
jgi:hypothetical protein